MNSVKYIGMDVHKEAISRSLEQQGNGVASSNRLDEGKESRRLKLE